MRLKVSKMTGKLQGLEAINTSSLDNNFCETMSKTETVCKHCFSRSMLSTFRKGCRPSWVLNGMLLREREVGVDYDYPQFKSALIRFNGHGELFNELHVKNLFKICNANPGRKFALWTKIPALVQRVILDGMKQPENLQLVYSSWKLNKICNSRLMFFNKVFTVWEADETNGVNVNCGEKKCFECRICYEENKIKYVNEILKGKKNG